MPRHSAARHIISPMPPPKKDRSHWVGGVARSHEEMDAIDQAWWLSHTPRERLRTVTELSAAADWSAENANVEVHDDFAEHGLRAGPFGIRKLGSDS